MPKRTLVVMTSPDAHAEGPIARSLEQQTADMFKALALGASAICLGRPYVYGLGIPGEHGVREVIQNLLAEFELTMALTGCATLEDVANATLERNPSGPPPTNSSCKARISW
ncbi:MAG: alpha-hydroxy-acid oxidizing protein, partial [Chthoniobacterales bacterium]